MSTKNSKKAAPKKAAAAPKNAAPRKVAPKDSAKKSPPPQLRPTDKLVQRRKDKAQDVLAAAKNYSGQPSTAESNRVATEQAAKEDIFGGLKSENVKLKEKK